MAADRERAPRRRRTRGRVLLLGCLVLLVLQAGCAFDRVAEEHVLQWYDLEEDVEIGEEVLRDFLNTLNRKKISYDEDKALLGQIREIVRRIGAVSHYPELPWEAHLAEVRDVNAWCAPGGKIVVYRGLVDAKRGLCQTSHELAAVLAHECAHATARHTTRSRSRTYTLLASIFPIYLAVAVFSPAGGDLFGLAFNEGLNLYLPSYSRGQELEADAIGLLYMAKAGYDPEVAVGLWRRAAKRGEDGGGLYATHPSNGERADALAEGLPEARRIYRAVRSGRIPEAMAAEGGER